MPKAKKLQEKPRKASWAEKITQETFKGLNINSSGLEPIDRNVPDPQGTKREVEQKLGRETSGKAEHDMTRKMIKLVSKALDNQMKLPFLVSDFEKAKKDIKIFGASAFRGLEDRPMRLTVDKGPAVVTDQAGVPILWYFPYFIGAGLQTNLMRSIAELASVYRPAPDDQIHDRRASEQSSGGSAEPTSPTRYMTRSRTAQVDGSIIDQPRTDQLWQENTDEGSPCTMEPLMVVPDNQPCPEMYRECEGEVRLGGADSHRSVGPSELSDRPAVFPQAELAGYPPFAYYLSPGWCQTGMQYRRSIAMSMHFREALTQGLDETIRVLESKRLLDKQIARLTQIIQPSLGRSLEVLRTHMSAVEGPTGMTVVNGWTSAFPCFGIAINRVTGLHRDTKGVRAGLDVIGVIGTVTKGGDLELPDLNLRLEWTPGCLGAFDGYDFRHKVHPWDSGSRVALISFCRESTWSALNLKPDLVRPTVEECRNRLALAIEQRNQAIQAAQRKEPGPPTVGNH